MYYSKEEILGALIKNALSFSQKEYQSDMRYTRLIIYDVETGLGIIRCNHKLLDVTRSSIEKLPNVLTSLVNAEVLGVSGTIKTLKRKFLVANI